MLCEPKAKTVFQTRPLPVENITLSTEIEGHAHGYLQIVIGLQGKAEFDINGSGNRIIPGQGCIITPDLTHAFGGIGEPSEILVLNFVPDNTDSFSAISQMYEIANSNCFFRLNANTTQLIRMLSMEVNSTPDNHLLSWACNHTIVALLQEHALPFQTRTGRLDMDAIDTYIAQHLQNKISVSQLAGSVFLSESQFHNQFKKQNGITPHQYVLTKRIEFAKRFIENSNAKLCHISDMVGFPDQSAFTNTFSKLEGISPSRYKMRYSS